MAIYRTKIIFPLLLLFVVARSALSIRITSEGLKRMSPCAHCQCPFSWKVDEPFSNYNIFNHTTGISTALRVQTHTNYDNTRGEITLTLAACRIWDAGNYSLVITQGSTTFNDSTACLFIYGDLQGSLILSSGQEPVTEGDTLELTCDVTSSSLLAAYRPNIYYSWEIRGDWHTIHSDGSIVPGYIAKNNGRSLVISSVQQDDKYIKCRGWEDGGNDVYCSHSVKIRHKPVVIFLLPGSRKANPEFGNTVKFLLIWLSHPEILNKPNWEFVNRNGTSQNLPPDSISKTEYYYTMTSLEFNFTSNEYYGNYSFNLTNAVGSTTATFEVLPEGPPETPSNVAITNVTHNTIDIHWNVMWSNSIVHQQTVFWQLTHVENGTIAEYSNMSYALGIYNKTYSHRFKNNIQPKTIYNVSVWSLNKLGSSEVVELQVKTREQPKLIVTTVSTKEAEESVNLTAQNTKENVNSIDREDRNSLLFAVIALTLLLGIISLACLTAYLVRRFRTNRQQLPTAHYQGIIKHHVNEESPQSHEDNVYEELEYDDHSYARISSTCNEMNDYENPI